MRASFVRASVLAVIAFGCVGPSPVPCTQCEGVCVDTQNDRRHCGACGNACAAGSVCTAGACVVSCPTGQSACSSVCFDLKNDPGHCGSCTRTCGTDEFCSQGNCRAIVADAGATSCPSGTTACDGGACFDQQNDPRNCGACGRSCNSTEYCSAGNCVQFPVMGLDAGSCLSSPNPCEVVSFTDAGCVVALRTCPAPGTCQTGGTCNPSTGACEYANRTGSCDDQNPCTQSDVCTSGTCVGTNPIVCTTASACHETSVCLPGDGGCSSTLKAEGSVCDDGDPCSGADTCVLGRCTGSIRPTLFEDFSIGSLPNGSKWTTTTRDGGVSVSNGQLTLRRAGQLVTVNDFRPTAAGPVRVTGEATVGSTDWVRVFTRSAGVGPTFTGVEFLIKGGTVNQLELRVGGSTNGSVAFTPAGTTVFEIFDDGTRVAFSARNKGSTTHAVVTATIAATATTGKIVFANGDDGATASSSTLDLLRIEQGLRISPTREWTFEELTVDGGIVGGFGVLPDGGSSGDKSARFVTAAPTGSPSGTLTSPVAVSGTFGAGVTASPATGGHYPEFPSTSLGAAARNYSLSFWVSGNFADVVEVFGNRTDGSSNAQNYVSIRAHDNLGVAVEYSTQGMGAPYSAFQGSPQGHLSDGDWHHVSVTRENRLSSLYVDGRLVAQVDGGTVIDVANGGPYWFGRGFNSGGPASYDELRVYDDVALNACEVRQLASRADVGQLCVAGRTPCAGTSAVSCVDLQTDSANCGACGNGCGARPNSTRAACVAGACTYAACNVGFFDCNGLAADGCERMGGCPTDPVLISVAIDGGVANGRSFNASVDNSGFLVTFFSDATNLVANDTNGAPDFFVRDLRTNTTRRLSVDRNGAQLPSGAVAGFGFEGGQISADGRFAAFVTSSPAITPDNNGTGNDVIVVDLQTGTRNFGMLSSTGTQPQPSTESWTPPFLSGDGRFVMWTTRAVGLVSGDTATSESKVFLYDRQTGTPRLMTLTTTGTVITQPGAGGHNVLGRFFTTNGRFLGHTTNAWVAGPPANGCQQTFLVDMNTAVPAVTNLRADDGSTLLNCPTASVTSDSLMSNANGTFFAFGSRNQLPALGIGPFNQLFYRAGAVNSSSTLITRTYGASTPSNGTNELMWLSDDGSVLAFASDSTDLVPGDPARRDCFVWKGAPPSVGVNTIMSQPVIRVVSTEPNACNYITLSRSGRWAVLNMNDSMSPIDTNNFSDIYLRAVP